VLFSIMILSVAYLMGKLGRTFRGHGWMADTCIREGRKRSEKFQLFRWKRVNREEI